MRVYLFDVDGTLVTAQGAGRVALGRALAAVYGTAGSLDRYDFRGKTDLRIVRDLMTEAGLPAARVEAGLAACFAVYEQELRSVLEDPSRVRLMPGVVGVVRGLAARPDTLVGLLTGNIEAGARLKLASTGLWPYFRVGAFGSDDADRRRLPAIARMRAQILAGREVPFEQVTIIGDTPLDVDCARACGAVAVAVATGQHRRDELAGSSPDVLLEDLGDVEATLVTLLGR